THSCSSSRRPSSTVTSKFHHARSKWRRTFKANIEVRACAWVLSSLQTNQGRKSRCPVLRARKSRSTNARSLLTVMDGLHVGLAGFEVGFYDVTAVQLAG